ncbi:universal stress protein [Azonexus sp.]|jgi:nucleotide-binding universal stress UspA family protein|uniref:universal stress protein n=1 Tax=Azonexus sp. TaxID=1872668 RepID=UPI0035ADBD0E
MNDLPRLTGRIVAATDFSPGAADAVERAAWLAIRRNAELHVLHVFDDSIGASLRRIYDSAGLGQRPPTLETRDRLSALGAALAERHGLAVRVETRTGRVADEIGRYVAEQSAGLLVVGERAAGSRGAPLSGDSALNLLGKSGVPVWLVRRPVSDAPPSVLVAVDFSGPSQRAAELAAVLLPDCRRRLIHVHVAPDADRLRMDGATPAEIARLQHQAQAQAKKRLAGFLGQLAIPVDQADCILVAGFPVRSLVDRAGAEDAGLIVLGRRGESPFDERLFGSVAGDLLQQLRTDVLLVP